MDMSKKTNDWTTTLKILDKAIKQFHQVMNKQSLIERIMEEKHGD